MPTPDTQRLTILKLQVELSANELNRIATKSSGPEARGLLREIADQFRAQADRLEASLDKPRPVLVIASWGDPDLSDGGGDSGSDYQDFPCS